MSPKYCGLKLNYTTKAIETKDKKQMVKTMNKWYNLNKYLTVFDRCKKIMNEPLVLQTRLSENKAAISRLKNVDLTHVGKFLTQPYKTYLVRLLDLLADDLININGGDYETGISIALDDRSLDIGLEKSYPFIFEQGSGPVSYITYNFSLYEYTDDKDIHQTIDNQIRNKFEETSKSWLYEKNFTNVPRKQKFYKYLDYIDKLLFDENTLVKKFSYLKTIYEDPIKKHTMGNITASIKTTSDGAMVTVSFGWIYIAITDMGILIRSSKTKEEENKYRSVFNAKEDFKFDDVEQSFLRIYNHIYETEYTDVKDLRLVHDMMEI